MAFTSGIYRFQGIHEDEAMQIALSESLHMYNAGLAQEEENLAMAIRMSLLEETIPPEDCPPAETKSDIGSDSGDTLRFTVGDGGSVRETLIQSLEERDGVEVSLQMESSDDGEVGSTVAEAGESGGVDLWDDFREMSSPGKDRGGDVTSNLKRGSLEYVSSQDTNTTLIDELVPLLETSYEIELQQELSPTLPEAKRNAPVIPNIQTPDHLKVSDAKQESLTFSSEDKEQDPWAALLKYTMSNDLVTIPNIGTFKRKEHFNPLATPQSIEQALHHLTVYDLSNTSQFTPQESPSHYPQGLLSNNTTPTKSPPSTSITIFPKASTSTAVPATYYDAEEERRSRNYTSLLRAQRRYAEKLSMPTGPDFRFTPQEWDSLGEHLPIEEWEAGFLVDRLKVSASCSSPGKHGSFDRVVKKENLSSAWKGKEKERSGNVAAGGLRNEIEDDDAVTLSLAF